MQGLPRKVGNCRGARPGPAAEMSHAAPGTRAVGRVADQRMADMGEVDPDLVGPAGQQPALDQRGMPKSFGAEPRARPDSGSPPVARGFRRPPPSFCGWRAAADIAGDLADGRCRHAPDDGAIGALDPAQRKIAATARGAPSRSWRRRSGRWCPCRGDGRCRAGAPRRSPTRLGPQCASSALTRVPSGLPGAGWTTMPAGLSMTIRCASSKRISSAIGCAAGVGTSGSGKHDEILAPGWPAVPGRAAARRRWRLGPISDQPLEAGARQLREMALQARGRGEHPLLGRQRNFDAAARRRRLRQSAAPFELRRFQVFLGMRISARGINNLRIQGRTTPNPDPQDRRRRADRCAH